MNDENEKIIIDPKPAIHNAGFSLIKTIASLAVFIVVDYLLFKNWNAVFLLVSIILIHESGHFIAMKIFGYKSISMTFIPFAGAFVSGEATHFSKSKKVIVLLAGPLPGVLLGMVLLFLYKQNSGEYYYWAGISFLLLNLFNLLPVSLLDGGQIIETVFENTSIVIQLAFLSVSLPVLFYLLFTIHFWFIIIIAVFILIRMRAVYLTYKVRKELDKKNISYNCGYEELTDEHYTQIRDTLIAKSNILSRRFSPGEHSVIEEELIKYIERILIPSFDYNLTRHQKIIFTAACLLAFILPAIQWMYLQGNL